MSRYFNKIRESGFTLIEVLVSLGIVGILLSVIVSNQSFYTDVSSISNLAEEISITFSQAQAYGIAVKELTPGSSDFSASYGISFSLLSDGSPSAYIFFADRNGNGVYDGDWACSIGGSSECVEKLNIYRGNYIYEICAIRNGQSDLCSPMRVDISFVRPDTEARVAFFNNGGQTMNIANMIGGKITLRSPQNISRTISVYTSGQISNQ